MGNLSIFIGLLIIAILLVLLFRRKRRRMASLKEANTPIKKKFDVSRPRRRYWSDQIKSPHHCPECQRPLEKEYHSYLFLIKQGKEIEPFLTGNEGGYFCPNCPVIVLDSEEFARMGKALMKKTGLEFVVAGIIDMEAIPEDKREVPLGGKENPFPVVDFLEPKSPKKRSPKRSSNPPKKRRASKKR